jgi:NADPH-dependent 2,4-dienoyl-CoA reductase/sulfur reductase-like enzyme
MAESIPSPLTIVGAGPAGIMAAYSAAKAGVDVTLIDDNPMPGGQYYRQSPPEFAFINPLDGKSGREDAAVVLDKLNHPKIRTLYNTQVWGVFDDRSLALADGEQSSLLLSDKIILASGAYDRPLAFPGWTLPGILGAGATLRMLKTQWVLPGKRILLVGLGPLQLALADALIKAGAKVVCVADATNPLGHIKEFPKFWGHWDRVSEAWNYTSTLRKHHVPLILNHAIIEATGHDQVESAKIARLDAQGSPIPGTERQYDVDAVCLGYGLLPSFQLASALGCELRFDDMLAWYAPVHNHRMETTRPGIFVAGDVTDIAGSKVALLEGQIAGLTAAYQLEYLSNAELEKQLTPITAELRHLNRLASALQNIYSFRPGLNNLAKDDTLLCRCEEITYAQAKQALAEGAADLHQLKLHTRAGMGYCQGRFCSVLLAPLVAQMTGKPLPLVKPFTVRPPIQPIPLRVLANGVSQIINK